MKTINYSSSYLKKYNDLGWVKIDNFFNNKKELLDLKKETFIFLKKNFKKYRGKDIHFAKSPKKYREINSFHKLHDCKYIKKIGKQIAKSNLIYSFLKKKKGELRAAEYFAKPARIGLYSPVHQDNFYWNVKNNNALTIWVALNSSSKKNGGVFYYDKSHKIGLLSHTNSFAKGSSQKIKNEKILQNYKKSFPTLKPGDALIHHVLVAHGSMNNKSNKSRKGVTFQIKDKSAQYDLKKIKLYKRNLKLQIEKRK